MALETLVILVCFGVSLIALLGFSGLLLEAAFIEGGQDRKTAYRIIAGLFAWAFVAFSAGYWVEMNFAVFAPFALIPILAGTALTFTPSVKRLLAAIPVHRLVFLQTYRMAGLIFVIVYVWSGELTRGFAMNAGWGDVLTGALAIPVGWMLWRGVRWAGPALIVWSVIGIGDLLVAPASAQIYGAGGLTAFPLNTIPLFLGPPFGILMHVVTLRIWRLSAERAAGGGVAVAHSA
ncbi:MAG: hypothetical protein AAF360_09520 [Pseudomonadota bacterium]